MPRSIDLTVISDDDSNKAFLRRHFEHVNGNNVKKRAGIFNREFKFKYVELNSVRGVYEVPDVVVFEVCPKKGESEQAFLERIRQECADLSDKIIGLCKQETNPTKRFNIEPIHLILVLNKTNLLSEETIERLQSHLKQMIVRYGIVFTMSTTQSSTKEMETIFLKAGQLAMRAHRYSIEPETNIALKALGAVTGLLIETLSDIIRCSKFFLLMRFNYRSSSNIFTFFYKIPLTLLLSTMSLSNYCVIPFFAIYNIYKGWRNGPAEVINDSYNRIYRDEVAGTFISALMISAALCVIFPPAGLAAILPTLIASVGLTGFSTVWLAIFAAAAVFVVSTSLYAMGSNLFDYVMTPAEEQLPVLTQEPIQLIPVNNAAVQMAAAPSATPALSTQQPSEEMGAVLPANASVFSTAAAASDVAPDADKSKYAADDAERPLLVPEGPN